MSLSKYQSSFLPFHILKGWRRTYYGESTKQTYDMWTHAKLTYIRCHCWPYESWEVSECLMPTHLTPSRHGLSSKNLRGDVNLEEGLDKQQGARMGAESHSVQMGVVPKWIGPLCTMYLFLSHICLLRLLKSSLRRGTSDSTLYLCDHQSAWHMMDN